MNTDGQLFADEKLNRDYVEFLDKQKATLARFAIDAADFHPCPGDATSQSTFDRHYVYHTAWAARVLRQQGVAAHVDISSLVYFSTILSAFIPVKFYEYRPASLILSDFSLEHQDLMGLTFESGSIPSLSCMHVVEHIGLGRYGDKIDPDGDLKAMSELKRVVAPGGLLLFVTPCGAKSRICFNAHRIYTYAQVLSYFEGFEAIKVSLVTDCPGDPDFIDQAMEEDFNRQRYGCGCFALRKLKNHG